MPAAYNDGMRALPFLIALVPVLAGAQQPLEREPAGEPRKNQKIERLQHEDSANRIEEVRVGGQSQSVTVTPKGSAMPAYELPPTDLARSRPVDNGRDAGGRQRVWNVFGF